MMNKVIGYVIAGGIGAAATFAGSCIFALLKPELARDSMNVFCDKVTEEVNVEPAEVSAE